MYLEESHAVIKTYLALDWTESFILRFNEQRLIAGSHGQAPALTLSALQGTYIQREQTDNKLGNGDQYTGGKNNNKQADKIENAQRKGKWGCYFIQNHKEALTDKLIFEQSPRGSEGLSYAEIRAGRTPS